MRFFIHASWIVSIMVSLGILTWYKFTPGEQVEIAGQWPKEASHLQTPGSANLVMFVHPECPCSLASMDELARLLPIIADHIAIKVVFRELTGQYGRQLSEHALWKKAKTLPHVQLLIDPGQKLENSFQAKTSGQTYLFDKEGRKIFQGGLTPLRGHTGETQASSFIKQWSRQQTISRSISSSVFGCPMQERVLE